MNKIKATRVFIISNSFLCLLSLGYIISNWNVISNAVRLFEDSYGAGIRIGFLYFLIIMVGLFFLAPVVVLIWSFTKSQIFNKGIDGLLILFRKRKVFMLGVTFLGLMFLASSQLALSVKAMKDPLDGQLLLAAQPALIYLASFSLLGIGYLLYFTGHIASFSRPEVIYTSLIFISLFGLGFSLLQLGYGHTVSGEITGNFDLAGFPVLGYQVIFAWGISITFLVIARRIYKRYGESLQNPKLFFDLTIIIVLFLSAFLLWNSAPLKPHYHIDPPLPPNYEPYPDSDAQFYDRSAQNVLAWGKFQSDSDQKYVTRRPLLTMYLAILHKIGGLGYEEIIPIQTAVFSLLPILVYLLTKSFHTRLSGVLAAFLVILREYNGLMLSDIVTGIHSKLLMSEIPTQMGVVLVIYLFVLWVKKPEKRLYLTILGGGVMGMTMLIRQESGAILPFMALGALIALRKNLRYYLQGMLVMGVSLVLVLAPWVYRNYHLTGKIFLDKPGNRLSMIIESLEINDIQNPDSHQPNSSLSRVGKPNQLVVAMQPDQLKSVDISKDTFRAQNQDSTLDLMVNHFTNQLVLSTVYLPSYPLSLDLDFLAKLAIGKLENYYGGLFYSPRSYVRALPYWWDRWDGSVVNHSALPVAVNLLLVAVGVYGIWEKNRWISILPFLAMAGHFTIYAIVRKSGGRYIQEVDWITGMYYAVGIAEVTMAVREWLWVKDDHITSSYERLKFKAGSNLRMIPMSIIVVIGFSLLLPLFEVAHPNHYPDVERQQKMAYLLSNPGSDVSSLEKKEIQTFMQNGGISVWGRGLYPQYIESKKPLSDFPVTDIGLKEIGTFPRFRFYLSSKDPKLTLIERDITPFYFPHGSDVLVIGCQDQGLMHALLVVIFDQEGNAVRTYWRDNKFDGVDGCPLPELLE